MSHIVKVQVTALTNQRRVMQAVQQLGLNTVMNTTVRGWGRSTETADIVAKGERYDVGVLWNGKYAEIVSDNYGVQQEKCAILRDFHSALTRKYAEITIRETLRTGYSVVERTESDEGVVKLRIRGWA